MGGKLGGKLGGKTGALSPGGREKGAWHLAEIN